MDVKYCYDYGGEQVVFTKDEISTMRFFGEKGKSITPLKGNAD
jgi:hypothetical protein